jgi:hypothetical protein
MRRTNLKHMREIYSRSKQEQAINQSDDAVCVARADGGRLSGLFERLRLEKRHDLHSHFPTN